MRLPNGVPFAGWGALRCGLCARAQSFHDATQLIEGVDQEPFGGPGRDRQSLRKAAAGHFGDLLDDVDDVGIDALEGLGGLLDERTEPGSAGGDVRVLGIRSRNSAAKTTATSYAAFTRGWLIFHDSDAENV
jgi:hypothetical protein